jgi:hypothetical protein
MTTAVERARQLIALAADKIAKNGDSDPEARSAALIAVKHIAAHKLEIVGPGETRRPLGGAPNPPPWNRGSSPWDGARVDPRGTPAPENWPPSPPPNAAPPPGYVPRRHARRHHGGSSVDMGRVPIPALHNGMCPHCRKSWKPGDVVAYKRGLQMTCIACRNKA